LSLERRGDNDRRFAVLFKFEKSLKGSVQEIGVKKYFQKGLPGCIVFKEGVTLCVKMMGVIGTPRDSLKIQQLNSL